MPLQNCLGKGWKCLHHQLLDLLQKGLNDEAKSLLQSIKTLRDSADSSKNAFLHCAVKYGTTPITGHLISKERKLTTFDLQKITLLSMVLNSFNVTSAGILLNYGDNIKKSANTLQLILRHSINSFLTPGRQNYQSIIEMVFEKLNSDFSSNKRSRVLSLLNANDSVKLAAIVFGSPVLAKFVLDESYFLEFKECLGGCTALHCAIMFAKIENAKLLIERGADVNATNNLDYTPLFYYRRCEEADKNLELIECLLKYSTDRLDLEDLISYGNERTVRAVLKSGIDVDMHFRNGKSLLHLLVLNKDPGILDLLDQLDIEFDVNARQPKIFGDTLLTMAVKNKCVEKVTFLLQHGADVSVTDTHDDLALDAVTNIFSQCREEPELEAEIVCLLLQYGIDTKVIDTKKWYLINGLHRVQDRLATKVIVAHLAMLEVLKVSPLTFYTRRKIETNRTFKALYDLCIQQVEQMKNTVVHDKISLLDLFNERDERKIMTYARDPEFVSVFNRVMKKIPLEFYFSNVLERGLIRAIDMIKYERKATSAIRGFTGLCDDMARKVISYLKLNEWKNICQAGNLADL